MGNYADLVGLVFSRLTVLKFSGRDKYGHILWLCRCECGVELEVSGARMRAGYTQSCGCLQKEKARNHPYIDLTGQTYGRLTVLKFIGRNANGRITWLCRCVCGKETKVITGALRAGTIRSCGCLGEDAKRKRGEEAIGWKGGRFNTYQGYVLIYKPNHPNAHKKGYVLEHIYVMSQKIGRPLTKDETVHHKNGVRDDNHPENLELWSGSHPSGQRVSDLVAWAKELLNKYEPKVLI